MWRNLDSMLQCMLSFFNPFMTVMLKPLIIGSQTQWRCRPQRFIRMLMSDGMSLSGPSGVQLVVLFTFVALASNVWDDCHEPSTLLHHIDLISFTRFVCDASLTELRSLNAGRNINCTFTTFETSVKIWYQSLLLIVQKRWFLCWLFFVRLYDPKLHFKSCLYSSIVATRCMAVHFAFTFYVFLPWWWHCDHLTSIPAHFLFPSVSDLPPCEPSILLFESAHKTYKMTCGPAKTQISLDIRPVW